MMSACSRTSSDGGRWFFFSSRRRHTRCLSDWSSDVCSSDLNGEIVGFYKNTPCLDSDIRVPNCPNIKGFKLVNGAYIKLMVSGSSRTVIMGVNDRSEERRVGKECRSRWSQYD